MMDDEKRPYGQRGLSCEHAPYLTLAIAVVEMARQDIAAGARVFENFGTRSTGLVVQQAAISWRWMSDAGIDCIRLSFTEICDATGVDPDIALDGVDAMEREFPPGYRRHLEHVVGLIDSRRRPFRFRRAKRKEVQRVGVEQEERRVGSDR